MNGINQVPEEERETFASSFETAVREAKPDLLPEVRPVSLFLLRYSPLLLLYLPTSYVASFCVINCLCWRERYMCRRKCMSVMSEHCFVGGVR